MALWQKVYASKDEIQAQIVKAILIEYELFPVLINKIDSVYNGVFEGESEVYVCPEQVIKAIKIIQDEVRFE